MKEKNSEKDNKKHMASVPVHSLNRLRIGAGHKNGVKITGAYGALLRRVGRIR